MDVIIYVATVNQVETDEVVKNRGNFDSKCQSDLEDFMWKVGQNNNT